MIADRAAIGFRAHSGWAAMVAVTVSSDTVTVVDRRRIELADPAVHGFPQPYHAAAEGPPANARQTVDACIAASGRLAEAGIRSAIEDLKGRRLKVVACGVGAGSGRALPPLEGILASHALIHTAEGEMFREALLDAATRCRLAVRRLKERDAYADLAALVGIPPSETRSRIEALGGRLGPPWREDQKLATAAAWAALHQSR